MTTFIYTTDEDGIGQTKCESTYIKTYHAVDFAEAMRKGKDIMSLIDAL
ncbi:MAG: hypothetical protein WA919_26400 [Coleofasciculaceae cyanobacterium]